MIVMLARATVAVYVSAVLFPVALVLIYRENRRLRGEEWI